MRKIIIILFLAALFNLFSKGSVLAQCAVCTKTAQQLGEKPAQGMNSAIIYLMLMPFAIVGFISYRWWKNNKKYEEGETANPPVVNNH